MPRPASFKFILIPIFLFIGLFLSTTLVAQSEKKEKPSFILKDTAGNDVRLEDYQGKIVLLNFWAAWCAPCIHEIPELIKLRKKYADKGFEILGLVHPMNLKKKRILQISRKLKIPYPVLWATEEVVEQFGGFTMLPRSFVLDGEGNVVEEIDLPGDMRMFESYIKKYFQ